MCVYPVFGERAAAAAFSFAAPALLPFSPPTPSPPSAHTHAHTVLCTGKQAKFDERQEGVFFIFIGRCVCVCFSGQRMDGKV